MIDIGANLTSRQFRRDLPDVITRARQAGIRAILVTGTNIASSEAALALAEAHPGFLYATAGLHPHEADSANVAGWARLKALLRHPLVKAVGETGLDYNRNFSSTTHQREAFERQLILAAEIGKPVFLHEREAFEDQYALLQKYRASLVGGVAHCFTGGGNQLASYLELDLYIGITGWVTDPRRGQALRDIVAVIPDDRLLLETDAPYLRPYDAPLLGLPSRYKRRNEPALLPRVASTVASARHQDENEVIAKTTANARRLFGLAA